ncbi:MAG TPA: RNA 2',3'-cyclic phosphodiesterase [Gemmatimonadales bacterium]|nr:RNA 2',3'-cyclic phosphodiesterase [Gemmatimonadales bacterium]
MRLFVALNLPDPVREALWRAAEPLRALDLPVRWVRPESLHVTLKFLGDVGEEREPELVAALRRAAGQGGESRPLTLTLREFGAFPDLGAPRVLWVGIAAEPALELLQHRVEREFAPLGFPPEGRPFRPHLTLGRAERDARARDFRRLAPAVERLRFEETVTIETLDLMQSTLRPDGAVYHPRHRERLS